MSVGTFRRHYYTFIKLYKSLCIGLQSCMISYNKDYGELKEVDTTSSA